MSYCASPKDDYASWDYLVGNPYKDESVSVARHEFLRTLACTNDGLLIALRDPVSGQWTKWLSFFRGFGSFDLGVAYDVHRSVLENEIVIESDYPTYEQNYEAARIIGAILESKGYVPHYYYSGSKSVHIHVYFDFKSLYSLDYVTQERLLDQFVSRGVFVKKFMEWLRKTMITCWSLGTRSFDTNLIKSSHLIRCELSRNKLGFKTFLGYTYKDMSFVPVIVNEWNRLYPELGAIRLSTPHKPQELIEEFLAQLDVTARKARIKRKERAIGQFTLGSWTQDRKKARKCIEFMLSDDFKATKDGYSRAMFFLANELKRTVGDAEALQLVADWNERMSCNIRSQEIEYRILRAKEYTMSCDTIHEFLDSIGFPECGGCRG